MRSWLERGSIVDAAWVDNGPGWIGVLLGSAAEVLAIRPREIRRSLGVVGAHEAGSKFAYEVRAFYSSGGVTVEDPVTGSLNASVAQWLIASGRHVPPYLASQGSVIGHAGVVRVSTDGSGGDRRIRWRLDRRNHGDTGFRHDRNLNLTPPRDERSSTSHGLRFLRGRDFGQTFLHQSSHQCHREATIGRKPEGSA